MATANLTETPQKIVDWMEKFKLDARSMQKAEKEDVKKEAEEVARLLQELQGLPNFDELLKQFAQIAQWWERGTKLLEVHKKGEGTHEVREDLRKQMREVIGDLKGFHKILDQNKESSSKDVAEDLKEELAKANERHDRLVKMVNKNIPGDVVVLQELAHRLEVASKSALAALEEGETPEEDDRKGPARKLALAEIQHLAEHQNEFIVAINTETIQERAVEEWEWALSELTEHVQSNLDFARKAPLRDEVVDKINECEERFEKVRDTGHQQRNKGDLKGLGESVATLKELEIESRGLMSNQAIGLQSANDVAPARRMCDGLFVSQTNVLAGIEKDLNRIKAVDPKYDDADLRKRIITARGAVVGARDRAYERFEAAVKGESADDVSTPMRADFEETEELIEELRTDANEALGDVDAVRLKVHDITPDFNKAMTAPLSVEGRKDLDVAFRAAQNAPIYAVEKLYRLDEFRKRCLKVIASREEGDKEGGTDYWTKKQEADAAMAREQTELPKAIQAKKLGPEALKFANDCLKEAQLHYQRDDVPSFEQAVQFLDNIEAVRSTGSTGEKATFLSELVRIRPMVMSAVAIDPAFEDKFDTLKKDAIANKYTKKDVEAAQKLHKECAEKVRVAYKEWAQALQGAAKAAAFARRLRDLKEDESASKEQQKHLEETKKEGLELTEEYEKAVQFGDRGNYPEAMKALAKFVSKAEHAQAEAEKKSKKILEEAAQPVDAQGKPITWSGPTAKVKDKDWGFNTNRDAMRYTAGQQMNKDGTLVVSQELDDIGKFLDFKLKKFRELCNLGQNPLDIARQVFDPVPENFWPPEAVKAVAVFRAAEREFKEEQLRKEAKQVGLNPDLFEETEKLQEEIEKAKKNKKLSSEASQALKKKLKEQGKELATEDLEKVSEGLALAEYWTATEDYGIPEIGKFEFRDSSGKLEVNDVVAEVGEVGELGVSVIKIGMSAADLVKAVRSHRQEKGKSDFRARKEDDIVSPVKSKMLEFERNRAIAQFVNNASDAVLNALSVGGNLPGMNIAGDVKGLVLAVMEAGRYFAMLAMSVDNKRGSEKDPDSITYLALARQAKEEGIAGGMKCFEAVTKILKLTGDAVQLAGIAAPAGFAINAVAQTLDLGGQACFKVYTWTDASKQIKFMDKARKQPPDYQAISEVFANTRKYARYCIAWGCLNDDAWARSWVMSRGLSDSDLDNPETGTAILREYINVTQEGLLGETQEDDPETFGESLPGQLGTGMKKVAGKIGDSVSDKINKRNREIRNKFFAVRAVELTAASWKVYLDRALKAGLYKTSTLKKFEGHFSKVESALADFDPDWKGKDSASEKDDDTYREKSEAYRAALENLHEVLLAYEPTANPHGKTSHECMKIYLGDLLGVLGKESLSLSQETDRYWKSSRVRRAGEQNPPTTAEKIEQEDLDKAAAELSDRVAEFDKLRADEMETRLKKTKFTTPLGDYTLSDQDKILKDAVKRLELDPKTDQKKIETLKKAIEEACEAADLQIFMGLSGLKPETDKKGAMVLSKDFGKQYDVHCETAGKTLLATLNEAYADAVSNKVGGYDWNAGGNHSTPFDAADAPSFPVDAEKQWNQAVEEASETSKGGWVKPSAEKKVGKAIKTFAAKHRNLWTQLNANAKALKIQSEWRVSLDQVRQALAALPCQTKFGTEHPGMTKYRDACLGKLRSIEQEAEVAIRKINATVDWKPTVAFFDGYPVEGNVYKNILAFSKARHLKKGSVPGKIASLFKTCDNTRKAWNAVGSKPADVTEADANKKFDAYRNALIALRDGLAQIQPVYDLKHPRAGEPHDGMVAYRTSVVGLIGDDGKGLIKDLNDHHAANKKKYKK